MNDKDKELLEKIGMTEAEANARGAAYENDEWDESAFEKPRCGKPDDRSSDITGSDAAGMLQASC